MEGKGQRGGGGWGEDGDQMVERWGPERQRRSEGEDEEGREGERKKLSRHALTYKHSCWMLHTHPLFCPSTLSSANEC